MRLIKCFTLFSSVVLFSLFCSVLASPFGAKLVNENFQGQVSAHEVRTCAGIEHFEVRIDETTWLYVDNATSYRFINVDDNNHVVWMKAFDKAGNINETYVSLKADAISLNVSIIKPNARVIVSTNVTIVWRASDNVSEISYYGIKLNNGPWKKLENETSYTYTELNDGNYTVYVEAIDNAGNTAKTSISFTVLTAPSKGALVDKWWFWLALAATTVFLIFVAFFVKRRNVLGKTFKRGYDQAGMRNPILPK